MFVFKLSWLPYLLLIAGIGMLCQGDVLYGIVLTVLGGIWTYGRITDKKESAASTAAKAAPKPEPKPQPKPTLKPEPKAAQEPAKPAGKFCRHCGAKAEPGDIYCIECGNKL